MYLVTILDRLEKPGVSVMTAAVEPAKIRATAAPIAIKCVIVLCACESNFLVERSEHV